MNDRFILDLFKYFAKFPLLAGVQKNFTRQTSDYALYSTFKTEIDTLAVHSLQTDLTDFVLGVNDEAITQKIKNTKSKYLFIDYGNVLLDVNKNDCYEGNIMLSIGVAEPFSWKNRDVIEESIIMSRNLDILLDILKTMKADSDESCSFKKYLTFPCQIMPLEPLHFYQSIGWAALFNWKQDNLMS